MSVLGLNRVVHSLFHPSGWPSFKKRNLYSVFRVTLWPIRGAKCCSSPAGVASWGTGAGSVAEMSEDESVTFQNKLAFPSRASSSVCFWNRRWKKRSRSWHLGKRANLFLHLRPTCRPWYSPHHFSLWNKWRESLGCLNCLSRVDFKLNLQPYIHLF